MLILPSFLYFDQGSRSCPRASCIAIDLIKPIESMQVILYNLAWS